jgi:hypothetical protein
MCSIRGCGANYLQPGFDQMDAADATGPDACCDAVTARVTLGH